ncbi:MAG: efflux transporter outer membrane subunit [Rudaea sp.]|nr:efflux transporter outer membrane subunit [Rudaea sp.]
MRISRLNLRVAVAIALPTLLAGCAVGPDFKRPKPPEVKAYQPGPQPELSGSQRFLLGKDIEARWWTQFGSKAIDDLVDEAFKHNPDLEAAKAALRVAQETVLAQKGAFFPTVGVGFNPTRQRIAGTLASPAASGRMYYNLHTAQVNISYTPDIFGNNRRQVESLEAQAEGQKWELEAAYISLASNVVLAAIGEASLRAQIAATRDIIDTQVKTLASYHRQLELGQVARLDVAAQEAALAQAEATLPPLDAQLSQQRDLIAALVGKYPDETIAAQFELSTIQLPHELPISLPLKLVEQRPDVREAETQLHSASAAVGVTIAARLPSITLTASGGSAATDFSNLFKHGTIFWNLASNITQPIFQGGTLLHNQRAAEAAYDQAAAQYRSTVISAFQNVADTLHAIRTDADAENAAIKADQATARTLAITQKLQTLGNVSYLALLSAEQAQQQARMALVQAQAARLSDSVALFQALGGGWWNRTETVASGNPH